MESFSWVSEGPSPLKETQTKSKVSDGSLKMADVHPVAPDGMSDDSTPGDDTKSVDGQRTCTVCGNPVKGHLGACGKLKCVFGLVERLTTRVGSLEEDLETSRKQHEEHVRLSEHRQEGHLKTIGALKEEVEALRSQIESQSLEIKKLNQPERKKERTTPPLQCTQKRDVGTPPTNSSTTKKPVVEDLSTDAERDQPKETNETPNAARPDVETIPSRSSEENTNPWHLVRRRKPLKPQVIPSEATRPEQPSTANPASPTPVLKGAVPIKRCVLFVGGIDVDCDETALIKFCRSKNVRVSSCRFLRSKLFGTKSARLSVSAEDAEAANILDKDFWPDNITARPWKFPPKLDGPDTEISQTTTRINSS